MTPYSAAPAASTSRTAGQRWWWWARSEKAGGRHLCTRVGCARACRPQPARERHTLTCWIIAERLLVRITSSQSSARALSIISCAPHSIVCSVPRVCVSAKFTIVPSPGYNSFIYLCLIYVWEWKSCTGLHLHSPLSMAPQWFLRVPNVADQVQKRRRPWGAGLQGCQRRSLPWTRAAARPCHTQPAHARAGKCTSVVTKTKRQPQASAEMLFACQISIL